MNYTDLNVWKACRELVLEVYRLTNLFPEDEKFNLTTQINRSAVSVPSNIAEGCGRNSNIDNLRFLYISRGSLFELETQLYLSYDLDYIDIEQKDAILEKILNCKKLLNGFIKYLKQQTVATN